MRIDSDYLSDKFTFNVEVRQGDNLRPTLIKFFINNSVKVFNESCSPVCLENLKLNCLMYADNLVFMSETSYGLQNRLDILH